MFSSLTHRADSWRTEDSESLSDARYWSHARYPSAKAAALAYLQHRTPGAMAIDYAAFGEIVEDTSDKLSPVEIGLALYSVFLAASKRTHPHHWGEWEQLRVWAPYVALEDDGALFEELTATYSSDHSYRDRIRRVDKTVEDYLRSARMWRPRRNSDDEDDAEEIRLQREDEARRSEAKARQHDALRRSRTHAQ